MRRLEPRRSVSGLLGGRRRTRTSSPCRRLARDADPHGSTSLIPRCSTMVFALRQRRRCLRIYREATRSTRHGHGFGWQITAGLSGWRAPFSLNCDVTYRAVLDLCVVMWGARPHRIGQARPNPVEQRRSIPRAEMSASQSTIADEIDHGPQPTPEHVGTGLDSKRGASLRRW